MSYLNVKNGIIALLKQAGFAPSKEVVDFDKVATNKLSKSYIINSRSGARDEDSTLASRVQDIQVWEIQIAYPRNANNDLSMRDQLGIDRDNIIKIVDNYANWQTFVKQLKYLDWDVTEEENYFLLILNIEVIDINSY